MVNHGYVHIICKKHLKIMVDVCTIIMHICAPNADVISKNYQSWKFLGETENYSTYVNQVSGYHVIQFQTV